MELNVRIKNDFMDALIYLVGTLFMFLVGFYAGWKKGLENGHKMGYEEGIKDARPGNIQ